MNPKFHGGYELLLYKGQFVFIVSYDTTNANTVIVENYDQQPFEPYEVNYKELDVPSADEMAEIE